MKRFFQCILRVRTLAAAGFVLVCAAAPLSAQATAPGVLNTAGATSTATLDWERGVLTMTLTAPLDSAGARNRSTLFSRKESELKAFFPPLFPLFVQPVRIDSSRSMSGLMAADTALEASVRSLSGAVTLRSSSPTRDLGGVIQTYEFSLFPHLPGILDHHREARPLDRVLGWLPAADHSGLVIHAKGELPWYGTDRRARLIPVLLPRVVTDSGRILLDADRLEPAALARWGVAGYSSAALPDDYAARVGRSPLVATARGVYGLSPADVVISESDALELLASETSRRALSEGRVLIILERSDLSEATGR